MTHILPSLQLISFIMQLRITKPKCKYSASYDNPRKLPTGYPWPTTGYPGPTYHLQTCGHIQPHPELSWLKEMWNPFNFSPFPTQQVGSNFHVIAWLPQLLSNHLGAGATLPWKIHVSWSDSHNVSWGWHLLRCPKERAQCFPTKARSLVSLLADWDRHLFQE